MKYNFKDFDRNFPNDEACMDFIYRNRWPKGAACECGKSVVGYIENFRWQAGLRPATRPRQKNDNDK
jgi:hypothetical protein